MADLDLDFTRDALAPLEHYVTIPCISPDYDASWAESGHLLAAAQHLTTWARSRDIGELTISIEQLEGRTPLIFAEIGATTKSDEGTVAIYGHFDKQPPLGNWSEGLDPFTPVVRGGKLFGRGTGDDGYSIFSAILAIEALERAGISHSRIVLLIEGSEESGSPDLEPYMDALEGRIGNLDLLICLDSGAQTYDRLWLTQSLRGNVTCKLHVQVLENGMHSGEAGGVVPSSFRILRHLLDRIEDSSTGEILLPELHGQVPSDHHDRFVEVAHELGDPVGQAIATVPGLALHGDSGLDRLIAQAWKPALAVTGIAGIPSIEIAGNVLRASTTTKLSFRLPPSVDAKVAASAIVKALEANPPHGATVSVSIDRALGQGWECKPLAPWLDAALERASIKGFGRGPSWTSEGGSIPFLAQLGARFPDLAIVATGVLGPGANAHGPDESLDLNMANGVTKGVASLLADFVQRSA
jgi:acetylornithine deacetylase/succinyl-diaminopimelate desuccinylase-like protein